MQASLKEKRIPSTHVYQITIIANARSLSDKLFKGWCFLFLLYIRLHLDLFHIYGYPSSILCSQIKLYYYYYSNSLLLLFCFVPSRGIVYICTKVSIHLMSINALELIINNNSFHNHMTTFSTRSQKVQVYPMHAMLRSQNIIHQTF